MPDQFVAIRNDGTWSGSISDENSSALESFAHNFFRRTKSKAKSKSPPPRAYAQTNSQTNGSLNEPTPETIELYKQWSTSTALLFASALAATTPSQHPGSTSPSPSGKRAPKKLQIRTQSSSAQVSQSDSNGPTPTTAVPRQNLFTSFPYLPSSLAVCPLPVCALQKADPGGLRACKHDVERLLRASGSYTYDWLRQERLRWHPDRFGRLCAIGWREEGKKLSEEMFKIIDILMGEMERAREGR